MQIKNKNISYFENIFYWFWHYFKKIEVKGGRPAEVTASAIAMAFKIFNFFFVIVFLSVILGQNLVLEVLPYKIDRMSTAAIVIPIVLVIIYFDDRKYLHRFPFFKEKIENQTDEQRRKSKITFFIYLLITAATTASLPYLITNYLPMQ